VIGRGKRATVSAKEREEEEMWHAGPLRPRYLVVLFLVTFETRIPCPAKVFVSRRLRNPISL